jgi:hypothetical protein
MARQSAIGRYVVTLTRLLLVLPATDVTLDPNSPTMVIRSNRGQDDWNAIDSQGTIEEEKKIWLRSTADAYRSSDPANPIPSQAYRMSQTMRR